MWAATIVGLLIGRYAGINLLIPLVGAVVTFYALKKMVQPKRAAWFPAISIQVGHAIWFIVGLAILGQFNANALDPAFLLLGSLWLLLKPGTLPVIVLSVLQLAAVSYNVYVFSGTAFGTNANEALSVHIIFRALAVGFMLFAWFTSRREVSARAVAP
jgi:hypothetical protein